MMNHVYLSLPMAQLSKLKLGQTVTVEIKGKVKSMREGLDPKEYQKKLDSKEGGCCCGPYEAPAEVQIEEMTAKITSTGKVAAVLDDED